MAKLFEKKPDDQVRIKRIPVLVTVEEHDQIKSKAKKRNLNASDYMRRAALGRRADVDHETAIVLALSDHTRSIRELHAAYLEKGDVPPEPLLAILIQEAKAAMLRITK